MTMKLTNKVLGLCVICDAKLPTGTDKAICKRCHQPADLTRPKKVEGDIYDVKSMCCGADVELMHSITCSAKCHTAMIKEMENTYGEYKRVVDLTTGIAHKVPTQYIIEHGIRQEDLKQFPHWEMKNKRG